MALWKERETLRKRFLTTMESKDRKKYNPHTSMEADKQVPPQVVFDAFGPGGVEVDEGSRQVSISDKKKVTAVCGVACGRRSR